MKFKKVEIQAFRAYNAASDGTFNFETKSKEYADFVSIYAPNGFGKTSFYDAVEWGVTKNIHRFLRKQKFNLEYAKSEKSLNSSDNQFILRNRYSPVDLQSYVKLTTTDSTVIGFSVPKPRKGQPDYKFDKKDTIRPYFQEVVLSQEWIDAFLKEDDPTDRYKTFIEYFGDRELDGYYKSLIAIIKANDDNIKVLTNELNGLQLELKFEGDTNILQKVNSLILDLVKKGEILNEIDASFTSEEDLAVSNKIIERKNSLDFKIIKARDVIKSVETAFSGDGNIVGMNRCFSLRNELILLTEKENDLNKLLGKYQENERLQNELTQVREKTQQKGFEKNAFEEKIKDFPKYIEIQNQINAIEKQILDNSKLLADENPKNLELRKKKSELESRQASIAKQIEDIAKRLANLPILKTKLENNNTDILKANNEIIDFDNKIEAVKSEIAKDKNEIESLDKLIQDIQADLYPTVEAEVLKLYASQIAKIETIKHEIKVLEERLNQSSTKIELQQSLNKEIESFIAKGLQIVNNGKTSSCPLCTQEYDSYSSLANKISNNDILSIQLRELLIEKTNIDVALGNEREKLKNERDALIQAVNNSIESKNQIVQPKATTQYELEKSRGELTHLIQKLTDERSENLKELNGNPTDEYEKNIKTQRDDLEIENLAVGNANKEGTTNLNTSNEHLEVCKKNSTILNNSLASISKDPTYLSIKSFFAEKFPSENILLSLLNSRRDAVVDEINNFILKEKELRSAISELEIILVPNTKDNLLVELNLTLSTKNLKSQEVIGFEQLLKSLFNIDLREYDESTLTDYLNNTREDSKKRIVEYEKIIELYSLLAPLKDNILPFLKFETAKISEREKKDRIKYLKGTVKKAIELEKTKVVEFLNSQINSFFYEDLINELYRKIDPHPEYKKIKFKCDFSEDKPQLNVCVIGDKEDVLLIPNLYFSTAQLNILSLSIFLAKALNAKNENSVALDCIFIDDPIQSMDSINILSTIDLLRSIVVNQKKQIILSTHDENFHNLLKKKMPDNLFKSKFIELETFGKVKQS